MPHHIAQLNVGRAVAPLDSPQLADRSQVRTRIGSIGAQAMTPIGGP